MHDLCCKLYQALMVEELEKTRQDLEATQKENENLSLRLTEALKAIENDREKVATALTQA